jgi:two-component system nitrate/nitrite sensor histidine kinase NarX
MLTTTRNLFRPSSRKVLNRSLLLRIGGAIAAIALLAVVGMAVSGLVAESTQGSGEAINRAGSLRMLSWKMASQVLTTPLASAGQGSHNLKETIHKLDSTLEDAAIKAMLPRVGEVAVATTYHQVKQEWQTKIRPRFLTMADNGHIPTTAAQNTVLLDEITLFVAHINQLVKQLEDTTEAKILVMRLVLGGALILTVLVVLLSIWLIHTQLVQPMSKLLTLAANVGRGDLSARTEHTGEDELGELGRAFNLMAEDLSKMYQDQESRVRQKTEELTRSNHSLELLYHSIARLHGGPPGKATYIALLRDIEQVLELGHGVICLGEQGGNKGVALASTMEPEDANPCGQDESLWCHGTDQTRFSIVSDFHRRLTLPLADAEKQYGVLILDIPEGRQLEAWQVQLLEALSRHIGVAIGAERRIEQNRRVALLEERAVIARELHDSLAQSLAYMKIQVSRLQHALKDPAKRDEADQVLLELREGMSGAYRQLRELLTTFRLKMEGQDLPTALRQTVDEFIDRGGLAIDLEIKLEGCPLSPNEEIHILHIVREALSNVLNHAHATHVKISLGSLADGQINVTVADDGIGIAKPPQVHHYGMTIMEERARTLAGSVAIEARPTGGTQVTLSFRPSSRRPGNSRSTYLLRRQDA